MEEDLGEQSLTPRTILGGTPVVADSNEVLGAGQDENILGLVVKGYAFGSFAANAGNTEIPAESERTVSSAGAVDQTDLGLKPITARRKGKGDCEVPRTGVEI